jgi:hypothetical protein
VVYYSSIIFLYGAEATQLSATALGWRIEPIEAAEQLDKERTREKVLAGRVPVRCPRQIADAHVGRPRRVRAITSQAYGRETLCRVERFRVRLTPTRR